jgi:hypothetical protein
MSRIDPVTLAGMKHGARCPDCISQVRVIPNGHGKGVHRIDVHHDDTCPSLARLRRTGMDRRQFAIVRGPGQSAEDFAAAARDTAEGMATEAGRPVGVLRNPYSLTPMVTCRPRHPGAPR